MLVATVIEVDALLQTAAAALVAGVGVTLAFSIAIYGSTRYAELSRAGRSGAAALAGLTAAAGLLVSVGAIAVGIAVMIGD